jgi:anti-anti-sigma factor
LEVRLSAAPACPEVPLLKVVGEIDHGNLFDLTIAVAGVLRKEAPAILVDLSQVTYIDSGGLSVLYGILRQMNGSGWLGVINPQLRARRMLDLIGLTAHPAFRVFSSLRDAEETLATCQSSAKKGYEAG